MRVCVYMKKDFKNTMQKKILKEQKFPYLKTFKYGYQHLAASEKNDLLKIFLRKSSRELRKENSIVL